MGLEVLAIGAVLLLASAILFVMLYVDAATYSDREDSCYYIKHPRAYQVIFYLLFIAFPINLGIYDLLRIDSLSLAHLSGTITFIFFMWPTFMFLCHMTFRGMSIKLGIITKSRIEYDAIFRERIKVIGWIGSIASFVVMLSIKMSGIETIVETPLFFIAFFGAALLLPSRKSLSIIRNKGELDRKDNKSSVVIILDLDGVVRHLDLETAERAAQSIGFSYEELMQTLWYNEYSYKLLIGKSTREIWWDHVRTFDPRLEGVSQDVLWDEVFEISTYDTELIEYVRGLKNKFRVGILTNCDKESKVQILDELGSDHPFDFVLSSSDFGVAKPDPAIFEKLLEKIGAEANQCVFFDDALANVEGAQDFGISAYIYEGLDYLQWFLEGKSQ